MAFGDNIGVVAAYGPDASRATKLVASVLPAGRGEGVVASRTWTGESDLRRDPAIRAETLAFFAMHGVRDFARPDRIIGCPHQEGIDYPLGRTCPACPFWEKVDRFTHQPIRPPAATMPAEEVLERLGSDPAVAPKRALESAEALRPALTEPLLQAMQRVIDGPADASDEDASLFRYALYLFAKWREPRACPLVIRWLSLPGEEPFGIGGDIVTQDGARILAAVFDGHLDPIESLVANAGANGYSRGVALEAIALLAAWGEIPRHVAVASLLRLERERLERVPDQVWSSLAVTAADHAVEELLPAVQRAYDEGLVDPMTMQRSELDAVDWAHPEAALEAVRERRPPIDDVADATSWWGGRPQQQGALANMPRVVEKVGRNEPCPCGSGKKYKKCCGG